MCSHLVKTKWIHWDLNLIWVNILRTNHSHSQTSWIIPEMFRPRCKTYVEGSDPRWTEISILGWITVGDAEFHRQIIWIRFKMSLVSVR